MARGEYTETLTIRSLERMNNSVNGNPKFRVTFTNGLVSQTQTDSGIAYAISLVPGGSSMCERSAASS